MINNPNINKNKNNDISTFKKINNKKDMYQVGSNRTKKSGQINPNQNLKKQSIRYMSNQYDIVNPEGRRRLIKDFLFFDCRNQENYEINYEGDNFFGYIYEKCSYKNIKSFIIIDNSLYKTLHNGNLRLCIPTYLLEKVISRVHKKLLHGSKRKIKSDFKRYFFHPLSGVNISEYSNKCLTCRCKSISQIPGRNINTVDSFKPKSSREVLDISIIRNLPNSTNYTCILILVDRYTMYTIALPLLSNATSIIEHSLRMIFSTIGFPRCVLANNNLELNIALNRLINDIYFQILTASDVNIEIENSLKTYVYDTDLNSDTSNWKNLISSAVEDLNNLPVDSSHMSRKEFFYKSTGKNLFNMLGCTEIFNHVNRDIEAMNKFIKIMDSNSQISRKKSKKNKKLKTIHTGDIVFMENPEINTSKGRTTLLKLELFQVLRKNRHAKTIEIISLKTGQKCMSNKNLIRKIFVNDFISQDNAEECIRIILEKLVEPENINFNREMYECNSNKNNSTITAVHPECYITEIETMLESENALMDTYNYKHYPPDV